MGRRELCGGGENRKIGEEIAKTSELDHENYVKPIRTQDESDMAGIEFLKEGRIDRKELGLEAGSSVEAKH